MLSYTDLSGLLPHKLEQNHLLNQGVTNADAVVTTIAAAFFRGQAK